MNAEAQRRLDDLIDYYEKMHERSQAYANIVMGAGFAGYFALWGLARDHIPPPLARLSLFAISMSLTIFVVFEIAKMLFTSRSIVAVARLREARNDNDAAREVAMATAIEVHRAEARRFLGYWSKMIGPCILLGVVGAGLLMGALLLGV